MTEVVNGVALYLVFLFSTTFHEAAHSWVALKGGDRTAYEGGQVTLDPAPHIRREPVGMVALPVISILLSGWPLGFASAPYDPAWAERHPNRAAWMALAGPGANLFLALCAGLLINLGMFFRVFDAPDTIGFTDVTVAAAGRGSAWEAAAYLLGMVFALNLLLAVFNLLPLPPLDGSAGVMALLPRQIVPKYQGFLAANPYVGWVGIFIAWQAFDSFFDPVFSASLNLLYLFHGVSYG